MTPRRLVYKFQRFGGVFCFHPHVNTLLEPHIYGSVVQLRGICTIRGVHPWALNHWLVDLAVSSCPTTH